VRSVPPVKTCPRCERIPPLDGVVVDRPRAVGGHRPPCWHDVVRDDHHISETWRVDDLRTIFGRAS
jgi:hypothetical protein